jgi:hypothetical protein
MRKIAEKTEDHVLLKNRAVRKALLARVLQQINDGEISNLQQPGRMTKEYISPPDRSSNNYGYMNSWEMGAGSPNIP